MTYCKVYCGNTPPTEVDKCEMLKPQLVRLHSNSRKTIKFKLFETCHDTLESNARLSNRRTINLANRFVANLQRTVDNPSIIRFKVMSADGTTKYNSTTTIDEGNLFSVVLPALQLEGYYSLVISRRGDSSDSVCSVKLFFCP